MSGFDTLKQGWWGWVGGGHASFGLSAWVVTLLHNCIYISHQLYIFLNWADLGPVLSMQSKLTLLYHEGSETAEWCWWSEENAGWRDWCEFSLSAGLCALLRDKLQVYYSLFVMQAPAQFQSTRYINSDFSHKMQDAERPATKLVGLMCVLHI